MNRPFIYQKPNQGSVLVVCLWVIMILSVLGLGITGLVLQEINFSKTYTRLVTSPPIVQGALKRMLNFRAKDLTPAYDTWDELSKEEIFDLAGGNSYRCFFVDKIKFKDKEEIIDESALINLNLASAEVLARLPGMDEDMAQAIVRSSWRPFRSINEVLLVEDISKEKFLLFKDYVTIFGTGRVNINTASREVLMALGLEEEVAKIILRFRREHEIKPEVKPPDKGIFSEPVVEPTGEPIYGIANLSALLNDLREYTMLSLRQEQDLLVLLPVFTVKSEYLRFNVITTSGNHEGLHYSIVINPQAKKVLSWRED
ncbi:MAG: helix-hairpin-helix domain-containing protein [Candidatus Omnitrophota bacterium]